MSVLSNSVSVLDNNTTIKGDIISNGILDIGGIINGKISAKQLNVKNGGVIIGEVFVEDIVIAKNGKIEGNVKAKSIKMLNGSYIKGDLHYNTISIEDGSVIEGNCHHEKNDKKQNNKDIKVDKDK